MVFTEKLGEFYNSLEEKFFGLMDSLEAKGLPVYDIINPLEDKGVPVFPATIALIILIFLGFGAIFLIGSPEFEYNLRIIDQNNNPLTNVQITAFFGNQHIDVYNSEGVKKTRFDSGDTLVIKGVRAGEDVKLVLEKNNYFGRENKQVEKTITLGEDTSLTFVLFKEMKLINGKVLLFDALNKKPVSEAIVTITTLNNSPKQCVEKNAGEYNCEIINNTEALIQVKPKNYYEPKDERHLFTENNSIEILLQPKQVALEGQTKLILKPIDAETKTPLTNTQVKIFEEGTETIFFNDDVNSTELPILISKGTSIHVIVSKQGYVSFDSSLNKEIVFELRDEQEVKEIPLIKGGDKVSVEVVDASDGVQLIHAMVQLFNLLGEKIGEEETNFAGVVNFESLDPNQEYYVTAYATDYLPKRKKFNPFKQTDLKFELVKTNAQNSSILEVNVVEENKTPANNATVLFYEDLNGVMLPIGLPAQTTDLDGKIITPVKKGSSLKLKAVKEYSEGTTSVKVEKEKEKATIYLHKIQGVKGIDLTDLRGNYLKGSVKITDSRGNVLFEGEAPEGTIWFDSLGNDTVNVEYTSPDGVTYSEEVSLKGKEKNNVRIPEGDLTGLEPKIDFKGLFNDAGKEVKGLKRGETGALKFVITYPEGKFENGLHVRVGGDEEVYADSMDVGITGFQATASKSFFGRTYSKEKETMDYANEGEPNTENKFLELKFEKGGLKEVKVKVKAKENGFQNNFEVHYRAWTRIGEKYLRTPIDSGLKEEKSSETKDALYAETKTEKFLLFDGSTKCSGELCASFKFKNNEGVETPAKEFTALNNKNYSLIIDLIKTENGTAKIKANTNKTNPILSFNSTAGNEGQLQTIKKENQTRTSIETPLITLTANQLKETSVFFNTREIGNTYINVQIISGKDVLTKEIHFPIEEEKKLNFEVNPDPIEFGKDFTIKVTSKEGTPLTEAIVKIFENKKEIKYLKGNNTVNNGRNGEYKIKNNFDAEKIEILVKQKGFATSKKEFEITRTGLIQLPKEITIIIPKNDKQAKTKISVKNNSKEIIDSITTELKPGKNFPEELLISFGNIFTINPKTKQTLEINAKYEGEKNSVTGVGEVIIKGKVKGKYFVSGKTRIKIIYAPKINPNCLEFSKEDLVVYFLTSNKERQNYANNYNPNNTSSMNYTRTNNPTNQFNANYNPNYYKNNSRTGEYYSNPFGENNDFYGSKNFIQTQEIQLKVKNNCEQPIYLKPQVIPITSKNDLINIQVDEINLSGNKGTKINNEQTITIRVNNKLMRNYPNKKSFKFNIEFKASPAIVSIPLKVIFWNAENALKIYPRNMEFFLATSTGGQPIPVTHSVFIKNIGELPVQELSLSDAQAFTKGTTRIQINPNQFNTIQKNQVITTGVTVIPKNTTKATIADKSVIKVQGRINGNLYDFGPINVIAHVNPEHCLKVIGKTRINYQSNETTGAKPDYVTLQNTCLEDVVIQELKPNQFGTNYLLFTPSKGFTIKPTEKRKVTIILNMNEDWDSDTVGANQVSFIGYLPLSQTIVESDPIQVNIKIGENAKEDYKAATKRKINLCEEKGKEAKKEFWLPEIAVSSNCETKYCDAELMAEYLIKKIEEKINQAKTKALGYQHNANKTNCSETNYCEYAELGVNTNPMTVYLMQDKVTTELLRDKAKKNSSIIKNYLISTGTTRGYRSNQILIDGDFTGCGKYVIEITGHMAREGNNLNPGYNQVTVRIKDKVKTKQCTPKIQNLMNFLPKDKGLEIDSSYGTMMGIVTGENEFEETAKTLAKNLFGNENRSEYNSTSNNLEIVKGTTKQKLLELEMHETQTNGPITIQAKILNQENASKEKRKAIATEASKILESIAKTNFKNNICIDEENNTIKAKGNETIGKLSIKAENLPVTINQKNCAPVTIQGTIEETITLNAEPEDNLNGLIEQPFFENEEGEIINEIELKPAKKQKTLEAKLQVCSRGLDKFFEAQGKEITITAESENQGKAEQTIKVNACAIHPTRLIEKIKALKTIPKNGKIFFIPYWSNELETININDLGKSKLAEKEIKEAEKNGSNEINETINDPYRKQKITAKLVGMGACAATASALGLLKGGSGAIIDPIAFCIVPTGWEIADYWNATKNAKNSVTELGKTVKGLIEKIPGMKTLTNFLTKNIINPASEKIDNIATEVNEGTTKDDGVTSKPELTTTTAKLFYSAIIKKETDTGFIKSLLKKTYSPKSIITAGKTLFKGALKGGLSILAGTVTEKYWLKQSLIKLGKTKEEATKLALEETVIIDTSTDYSQTTPLTKGLLYSATITKNSITNENIIENIQVETSIPKNSLIIEDCDPKEYNKPFYLLKIYPTTKKTPPIKGHKNNVLTYYKQKTENNITLGQLISTNSKNKQTAALLVTIAIMKNGFGYPKYNPQKLFGCETGDTIQKNLNCATTKLKQLEKTCNKDPPTLEDKEVECILKEYNNNQNPPKYNYDTWVKVYNIWYSYPGAETISSII